MNVESIKRKINDIKQKIENEMKQYTQMNVVIIIGITGCGKSSISNCIGKKQVMIVQGPGSRIQLYGPGIQSGNQSITRKPELIIDKQAKIIIIDCPGFEDTNGFEQEIINSFIIDYLFSINSTNKIKILLAISAKEIENGRAQGISQSIKRISQMFPNPSEIEQILGLVITQGEKELTGQDYIEQIMTNSPENITRFCDFFRTNLDRVFLFPLAEKEKIGKIYEFDDYSRLVYFIQNESHCSNITHKIALSQLANEYIKNIELDVVQKLQILIRDLFTKFSEEYRKEKSSLNIKNLLNSLKTNLNSLNNLNTFIKANVKNHSQIINDIKNFEENESIRCFIKKLTQNNETDLILKQSFDACLDNTNRELIELLKKNEILEEQERKRIEYQKKMEENRRIQEQQRIYEMNLRRQLEIQRRQEEEQKRKQEELQRKLEEQKRELEEIEENDKNELWASLDYSLAWSGI